MKKYLPTILALLVLVAGAVADPVQGFVAQHPMLALVFTQIMAVLNHWIPSPKALGNPDVKL